MEADPPCDDLFVIVDQKLLDYYKETLHKKVLVDWIVPVLKSLQGHPEAGRMFDQAVNQRFTKKINGYQSRVEPSFITHKHDNGSCGVTLRQVDDFTVDTSDESHHKWIHDSLQQGFKEIKDDKIMKKYTTCNIDQTREYINVHGEDYIDSVLAFHGWLVPTDQEKTDPKEPLSPRMIKKVMAEKERKM